MRLTHFLIFSFLLTLFSCGKKGGVTQTTLILGGINLSATGDVYVTAKNLDLNQFQSFIITNETDTFDIPNGNWIFHGYHWNGGGSLNGLLFCGSSSQNLIGGVATVHLDLTQANCFLPKFTDATTISSSDIQTVDVTLCNDLSTVSSGASNCDAHPSHGKSFRLILGEITVSDPTSPALVTNKLIRSTCYDLSPGVSRTATTLRVPSGTSAMPFPFMIRAFDQPGCTGNNLDVPFPQGLMSPNTTERKVIDDVAPSPQRTSIYLKFFPAGATELSLTSASVDIPAESEFSFDLSKHISGGYGTITYAVSSGGGTLSGTSYTPPGTSGTTVITVSDDTGLSLSLTLNRILANQNDFTTSTTYGWTSARSTVAKYLSNANVITTASPGILRLAQDPVDSSIGLLHEGPTTNLIMRSDVFNLTPWTIPAGTVNFTPGPMTLSDTTSEMILNDTDIINSANSAYTTIGAVAGTSPGLDYTFSVFLKANTSSKACVYVADSGSSCVCLVVDLTNGSSMGCGVCPPTTESGVIAYPNGWYKVWMKENRSGSSIGVRIYPAWANTLQMSYDHTITGSVFAWGAQLENSKIPSSIVPTLGTTAIRDADKISDTTFASTMNQNQGTLLLKWNNQGDMQAGTLLKFIYNLSPSDAAIRIYKDGSGSVVTDITRDGSVVEGVSTGSGLLQGNNTYLMSYGPSSIKSLLNNNTNIYSTTRAGTSTNTYDKAWLGTDDGTSNSSNLIMKKIYYWNAQFTDDILKQMIP
ncbi:MAG: hypothetical protein Fur0010_04090 [Bdellovibrio sp.]